MVMLTGLEGIWCLFFCVGVSTSTPPLGQPDAFCAAYEQVVKGKGEVKSIMSLPKAVRDRVQGNELLYHCRCKGLQSDACFASVKEKVGG